MKSYEDFLCEWRPGHVQQLDGTALKPDTVNQLISQITALRAWTVAMAVKHPEKNKLMQAVSMLDNVRGVLNTVEQGDFSPYSPVSPEEKR